MERVKSLVREPAILLDAFESFVVVAIALGLFNLNGDQQTTLVAFFIALLAFAKGFLTKPFAVTLVPDLGRAGLVLCVSFGLLNWSADQVTVVVTFLGTLMTLIQRAQITPRYSEIVRPGGAGAGPVERDQWKPGEEGLMSLGYAGMLALIGGIILLLLSAVTALHAQAFAYVLIVLGIALILVDVLTNRSRR